MKTRLLNRRSTSGIGVALAALLLTGPSLGQGTRGGGPEGAVTVEVSSTAFTRSASAPCSSGICSPPNFGTVPANHRYEITFVSCYAGLNTSTGSPLYWYLAAYRTGETVGEIHLGPQMLGINGSGRTINAAEQGLLIVPAGISLGVALDTTAGSVTHQRCTISGYDVKLRKAVE
jgi:hypothetical protein